MRNEIPSALRGHPFSVYDGRAAGLSEQRMRHRELRTPHRGVRVAGHVPDTFESRCRAYLAIPRDGQFFSHMTAARIWGIPLPHWSRAEPLHVATSVRPRAARVDGVVGHRFADAHLTALMRHGYPVADPVSTWLHLATVLNSYDLVAAGDYLVRTPHFPKRGEDRPFATIEQLADRVRRHTGRGRRNAVLAVDRVRIGVDSPQETRLRLLMVDSGLPEPETDVPIFGAGGERVAWVDLFYPGLRLAIEYDGQQHRTNDGQYARDVIRLDAIRDAATPVIRVDKLALSGAGLPALTRIQAKMRSLGWPERPAK